MLEVENGNFNPGVSYEMEPYTVYAAGGLFTQHELATNVFLKKAVWELSKGKFALILPQSKELRDVDRPDLAAYIRNMDLLQVIKSDLLIARFDGLELDCGTVIEFMMAKHLGKPTVVLRCDTRMQGSLELDAPYNLMAKNWPRTVEVFVNSLMDYIGMCDRTPLTTGEKSAFESSLSGELSSVEKGIDKLAQKLIEGLEAALKLPSPYPDEYQEIVYRISRFGVGGGFQDLLTEEELENTLQRLRSQSTL